LDRRDERSDGFYLRAVSMVVELEAYGFFVGHGLLLEQIRKLVAVLERFDVSLGQL
jgi:hypothetical protein